MAVIGCAFIWTLLRGNGCKAAAAHCTAQVWCVQPYCTLDLTNGTAVGAATQRRMTQPVGVACRCSPSDLNSQVCMQGSSIHVLDTLQLQQWQACCAWSWCLNGWLVAGSSLALSAALDWCLILAASMLFTHGPCWLVLLPASLCCVACM